MSIVPLDKVTFYGAAANRDAAIDALQRFGQLHLVDLSGDGAPLPVDGLSSSDARAALKFLQACPVQRKPSRRVGEFDLSQVVAAATENARNRHALRDERDQVEKAVAVRTPWGEFHAPSGAALGDQRLWFYVLQRRDAPRLAALSVPYAVAGEDATSLYCVLISADEPSDGPGVRTELDPRSLAELQTRLDEIDETLEELSWQRVELTRWSRQLGQSLDAADDAAARLWAERLTLTDREVFAIQAWAPRAARSDVEELGQRLGLAVSFAEPGPNDDPPTLLQNPPRVAGAEGVVTFYITPAYAAWDPTPVMFVSFSLFFGMIVADAGYGLLMALLLAAFWRRLGITPQGARFRILLLSIVGMTTVFGVLVGSYFGMTPGSSTLLGRLRLLDFANRAQMMGLSILIGVAHLSLANLITAWRRRHSLRAIGSLGWVLMMLGTLLMASQLLGEPTLAPVVSLGKWLVLLGAAGVLLFSSDRPLIFSSVRAWGRRLLDGLGALTGVTKLFGDVLSYLRLFALGLASAQLAVTFNGLAADMSRSRGIGMLLAGVILIAGHGINLVLGLMGGVVHGLRLNCIEFFNWSLTEEGHAFRCFEKKVAQ